MLAPGIHRYLRCSSTKCFRAVQPRSIFMRYLRSINVSATASHRFTAFCLGRRWVHQWPWERALPGSFMIPFYGETERRHCADGREILPAFSSSKHTCPTTQRQKPAYAEDCRVCFSTELNKTLVGTHLALDLHHGSKDAASPASWCPFPARCRGAAEYLAMLSVSICKVSKKMKSAECCNLAPITAKEFFTTYCKTETRFLQGDKRLQHYQTDESQMIFKL